MNAARRDELKLPSDSANEISCTKQSLATMIYTRSLVRPMLTDDEPVLEPTLFHGSHLGPNLIHRTNGLPTLVSETGDFVA